MNVQLVAKWAVPQVINEMRCEERINYYVVKWILQQDDYCQPLPEFCSLNEWLQRDNEQNYQKEILNCVFDINFYIWICENFHTVL